jgi:hypothetical protein
MGRPCKCCNKEDCENCQCFDSFKFEENPDRYDWMLVICNSNAVQDDLWDLYIQHPTRDEEDEVEYYIGAVDNIGRDECSSNIFCTNEEMVEEAKDFCDLQSCCINNSKITVVDKDIFNFCGTAVLRFICTKINNYGNFGTLTVLRRDKQRGEKYCRLLSKSYSQNSPPETGSSFSMEFYQPCCCSCPDLLLSGQEFKFIKQPGTISAECEYSDYNDTYTYKSNFTYPSFYVRDLSISTSLDLKISQLSNNYSSEILATQTGPLSPLRSYFDFYGVFAGPGSAFNNINAIDYDLEDKSPCAVGYQHVIQNTNYKFTGSLNLYRLYEEFRERFFDQLKFKSEFSATYEVFGMVAPRATYPYDFIDNEIYNYDDKINIIDLAFNRVDFSNTYLIEPEDYDLDATDSGLIDYGSLLPEQFTIRLAVGPLLISYITRNIVHARRPDGSQLEGPGLTSTEKTISFAIFRSLLSIPSPYGQGSFNPEPYDSMISRYNNENDNDLIRATKNLYNCVYRDNAVSFDLTDNYISDYSFSYKSTSFEESAYCSDIKNFIRITENGI